MRTSFPFWACLVLLFILALASRLPHLNILLDRDGYDEGVYIQSLRAMHDFSLYSDIFYSQPPLFLPALYPFFVLFGGTILAARLAVCVYATLGFIGAAWIGQAVAGRTGVVMALILLFTDALYFHASTSVQAEGLCVNFLLLSLGAGLQWWRRPKGMRGFTLAILAGGALACSIMSKLFGVVGAIPLLLLIFLHFRYPYHSDEAEAKPDRALYAFSLTSVLAALAGFFIAVAFILSPFRDRFPALIAGNIGLHVTGEQSLFLPYFPNSLPLAKAALRYPLFYLALLGTIAALRRRDPLFAPAAGGTLAAFYILWRQFPLFPHHYVMLTPPLLFLALLFLPPADRFASWNRKAPSRESLSRAALFALIAVVVLQAATTIRRLRQETSLYALMGSPSRLTAQDMQRFTAPAEWTLTDAQFAAAQAQRSTPPQFVDTSLVRIQTGMLTSSQLIAAAQQPRCRAVLFFSGRLTKPQLAEFRRYINQNFSRVAFYGLDQELWVKK